MQYARLLCHMCTNATYRRGSRYGTLRLCVPTLRTRIIYRTTIPNYYCVLRPCAHSDGLRV